MLFLEIVADKEFANEEFVHKRNVALSARFLISINCTNATTVPDKLSSITAMLIVYRRCNATRRLSSSRKMANAETTVISELHFRYYKINSRWL
jgi:hypothetical protein